MGLRCEKNIRMHERNYLKDGEIECKKSVYAMYAVSTKYPWKRGNQRQCELISQRASDSVNDPRNGQLRSIPGVTIIVTKRL